MAMNLLNEQNGTFEFNTLDGTENADLILALSGNDIINSGSGDDIVYGDFTSLNLLTGTQDAASFAQYSATGAWAINQEADGHTSMTQSIDTFTGETYKVSFDLASNSDVEALSGTVEVLLNGAVIDSINTNSETISTHEITFQGTGETGELTLRSTGVSDPTPSENVTTA
jgi:Ca2+-binding RTX toxin-like protein